MTAVAPCLLHLTARRLAVLPVTPFVRRFWPTAVRTVARSFKYHRRRGIFAAGVEEPNAFFTVGDGAYRTPNVLGTVTELTADMRVCSQRGWPSVNFDLGKATSAVSRMLPPGFYYKTFMWPPRLWMFYEKIIRRAASQAPAPAEQDADFYTHRYAHCDVLVVGGGAAGLSAALTAAAAGAAVIIADLNPEWGGADYNGELIDNIPADKWIEQATRRLADMSNVSMLLRTTVQGYHDYNYLTAVQQAPAADSWRACLWKIRAKRVVIAAGAIERPLIFADNDSPGVMLAGAVRTYINRYGVLPGRRILFFTNNDSAYAAALTAASAGGRVEIADMRHHVDGYWQSRVRDEKIPLYLSCGVAGVSTPDHILATRLARLSPDAGALTENAIFSSHAYDIIAVSGGWTPTVHLFSQSRGQLAWNDRCGAFVPQKTGAINPCRACGGANGFMSLSDCLRDGGEAGAWATQGFAGVKATPPKAEASPMECEPLHSPLAPTTHPVGRGPGKFFVDFMNDVTADDIALAEREGYGSVEHMKRYTAAGFGADQGKTGNVNALFLLAKARGIPPGEVGHTTYRPQYMPLSFGVVAGADRRELFTQERTTPIHSWHTKNGAFFEDVGDWKRPLCFLREDEDVQAAVSRECKVARNAAAMMDATTLGKIDIQGPDAPEFMDILYTNQMSTLKPGRCRYGMMLREDGMVYDDGVAICLAPNHYHITTSTGHAAGVMTWLEEWLQTEWPHFRVFCTSVTEQWAVIALVGPKSREVLSAATDMALDAESFPFMSVKEGVVAGVSARVFRVSFSGELAFEINVPARYGLSVWETLFAAGKAHGITVYGTETMRVLRAEKGYIIAGQDTDGTVTPADMNLGWMISKKKKDFLGKRSLSRPDITKRGRLQYVGLLAEDEQTVLPEGSYLLKDAAVALPADSEGFITSSYYSSNLGRSIALGMVKGGFERQGETLYAAALDGGRIPLKITDTIFYDKAGDRRDG